MQKGENKLKYFIYARRSVKKSDREETVVSVESQKKELRALAEKNSLKIVGVLEETGSAKRLGRPVFSQMVQRIRQEKVNGILCWDIDRLYRDPTDEGSIRQLLVDGVIQEIRTPTRVFGPEDSGLLMGVEGGRSIDYVIRLSANIRRGLRAKLDGGHRPSIAPLGYLNSGYKNKGYEEILVDEERFSKVRKLFELMLTGQYTPHQLVSVADKELRLKTRGVGKHPSKAMGKSNMYRILTNPFYYGEFEFPEGSGNWYVGKHKAMITKEEYDKIQFLLGREGRPRPKNHIFAYTGLMRCAGCGARVTAEEKWKHQKNGNTHHYIYYRCTGSQGPDCTEKSVEVKVLEKQIDDFLSTIQIPVEFHEWAVEELKKLHEKEKGDRNSLINEHELEYKKCLKRLDKLVDSHLDGTMSDEMYKRKEAVLLRQKRELKKLLDSDDKRVDDWLERLESTLTFAQCARDEFQKGDIAKRRQILTALGTEHILKDRAIHINTEKPLLVLQEVVSELDSLEPAKCIGNKGQIKQIYNNSSLMWRWGVSKPPSKRGHTETSTKRSTFLFV